ncbi:PucR family transcriptional regulator [Blastococcus sp. SYSU D00813]
MRPTVAELASAADLEVVTPGEGLHRRVDTVRVLEGVLPETLGPGVLAVITWAASRRGSPLPPLVPLLAPVLASRPSAVLVVPLGRFVRPPAEVVERARESGVALLWPDAQPLSVQHLRRLVDAAPDEQAGPPPGLVRVLEGDLGLTAVAERVAELLGAAVRVTDAAGRDLVDLRGPAAVPADAEGSAMPLLHAGRQLGSWRVLRATPLTPAELSLVELVTPVLTLALRVHTTEERAAAPVQALLTAVLGDDLAARESAMRRSRRLAAFPARPALFLALVPFGADVSSAGLARLARAVEPAVRAADDRATVLVHEGSVVVLADAELDLDRLVRAMYRRTTVPLSVGAGRPVDDVRSFPGAHRQAQRAAAIGRALGAANRVTRYDDLGVTRLLYQLPEHERRGFVRDVLGAAAGPDATALEARRVLRAFRSTNGNVTEAARLLFLHHNTFRQRLAKLQQQVGDFVGDPDRRLAVFVALDLHRLDADREG